MPATPTSRTEAGTAARRRRKKRATTVAASVVGIALVVAAAWFAVTQLDLTLGKTEAPRITTIDSSSTIEAFSLVATLTPAPPGPATITIAAVGDM